MLLTDHGYGAVALAVRRQCRRTGATARTVALPLGAPDAEVVSRVRSALRPGRTRLLIVDQLTSATATAFPVREIAAAAREHDIPVLVDAAHAPGMLPVDVAAIGADFWVGNLHKWAFAPRGTALLAVAPGLAAPDRSAGRVVGAGRRASRSSVEFQGTLDYTPWLSAPAGLFVLRTLGVDTVRAHNAALAAYGQRVVGAALGLAPADLPEPGAPAASMRIVPLPAGLATTFTEAHALRQHIADKLAVETAINAWGGRGWLRLSAQVYNRPEEYDRLAERLPAATARAAAAAAAPGRGRAGPAGPDIASPRRSPQCRQAAAGQPGWPAASVPSGCAGRHDVAGADGRGRPARTWSAGRRVATLTTPRPATRPAKITVPGAGRVDRGARRRGEVHAAMAGQPRLGRRIEPAHDVRRRRPASRRRPAHRAAGAGTAAATCREACRIPDGGAWTPCG